MTTCTERESNECVSEGAVDGVCDPILISICMINPVTVFLDHEKKSKPSTFRLHSSGFHEEDNYKLRALSRHIYELSETDHAVLTSRAIPGLLAVAALLQMVARLTALHEDPISKEVRLG